MRNFIEVMNSIKNEIPEDYENKKDLFKDIDSRVDSMMYAAPEMVSEIWGQTGEILYSYLGNADIEWKKKVQNIFCDTN